MIEISLEYMNKLASQIIFIDSLLGGFNLTLIASLLTKELNNKYLIRIFRVSCLSMASFLASIFCMTNILMITTEGYPFTVNSNNLQLSRLLGSLTFFVGVLALLAVIAFAGWVHSKELGLFTTFISGTALIIILVMLL